MTLFSERLRRAARHAGVGEHQSSIARALGLERQTVNHWFLKGQPDADNLARIAAAWGVNAEWLRTGEGDMLPEPSDGLSSEERDLIKHYRSATPQVRRVISSMTRAVRKAVLTLAAVIPPLLASPPADAAICHNQNLSQYALHAVRRWLAMMRFSLLRNSDCKVSVSFATSF